MTRHSPKLAKSRLPSDFCQNRSQSKSLSMTPPSYSFHNSTLSFTDPWMLFVQDQRKAVQLLKRFKCRIIGELSNWKLRWFDQLSFFSSDKFNFRFSSRFVKLPCHIVILSFYPIVELHYIVFYGHELHWYCRSDPEWVTWVWHWCYNTWNSEKVASHCLAYIVEIGRCQWKFWSLYCPS